MSKNKLQLLILCGGQSAEHEVSINSARNVVAALDSEKYYLNVVLISKAGEWFLFDDAQVFLKQKNIDEAVIDAYCEKVSLLLGENKVLSVLSNVEKTIPVDLVFPVLHGTHGEDGTLQGLLELANIPYVGASVLGSSICMDKDVSKRLLRDAKIPVANWIMVNRIEIPTINYEEVVGKLGSPFFIKPSNTGSSVGISKVKSAQDFDSAVALALRYDHKIIFEEYIPCREIECAVLGNEEPEAAILGEIVPHHEFYTYEAKYIDPNGADLIIPADLPAEVAEKIKTYAKQAVLTLCCEGMARVDFFLTAKGEIYLNEANTIPGFTQISMYPKMWIAAGLSYPQLLDKLIELAMKRFKRDRVLVSKHSLNAEAMLTN
jgi:D-alanine-D-alanine ligase